MKLGILHPGAMGAAVAKTIKNSGYEVLWAGNGRSPETHARAQDAQLTNVQNIGSLCQQSDVILSICPPHAAEKVADDVLAFGFKGIYIDGNAISPQKSQRIGQHMQAAGAAYIDGGIIGGPPTRPGTTWLYLSGKAAAKAQPFFSAGPLEVETLDDEVGTASALKMCFAANTKGTTALLALVLAAADKLNVRQALETQWDRYTPEMTPNTHGRVQRTAHQKAWRFAGEMEEMVETFGSIGLPDGFHAAAADIYYRLADFKTAVDKPSIEEVLDVINKESD